jgi:hypothetical protein
MQEEIQEACHKIREVTCGFETKKKKDDSWFFRFT